MLAAVSSPLQSPSGALALGLGLARTAAPGWGDAGGGAWGGAFDIVRPVTDPLAQTVAFDETVSEPAARVSLGPEAASDSERRVIAGRYEVLGLVGTGGMGNVYRARDRELDELVALKVLRPEIAASADALSRFRREVKLSRRVTHPNVARVFDIGDQGGEKYLTMELVDGEPLGAALLRAGRLAVQRAVDIAAQVCAGLGAAHAAGVVHRDLKPDNVLLAKDGRVVVTDFGIARALASADVNITGQLVGTPAYMAPEQVEGKIADARADIYALGAMLFELLTGQAPWQGDSVIAVAAARLLHEPPDVRAKRPELSPELAAIIARCMARRPEDRFASVEDVARALSDAAAACRRAPPSPPPEPPPPAADPLLAPCTKPCDKHVAVLPFRSAGPEQEHIADGLTEDLIDQLSMAGGLRVRSRGTIMRYRGIESDPREIGRELNVPVVVDGSVRRDGATVRVSVRLVSVADGMQIWHRRFDRPASEIFQVSDMAARAISEALAVQLAAPARTAPQSAEAIDLYLRARSRYLRFFADLEGESVQLFERALAIAPDDPRILSGFAIAAGRKANAAPGQAERARAAAEKAVELGPNLAEAHVALATARYQQRREPEAIASLATALRMSPFSAEAHDMLGRLLSETQLVDAAQKHLETALALEPDMELARAMLSRLHMLRGARELADEVLASARGGETSMLPSAARFCVWTRDVDRAKRLLDDRSTAGEPSRGISELMLRLVAEGRAPFESPLFSEVPPRMSGFLAQVQAECSSFLNQHDRAIAAVERAAELDVFDVAWADGCPLFAPYQEDPRFRAARARIAARARRIADAYEAAIR
jgi:serine/threonine-protein kinase